jgi:D-arginine dehydrogenase
MVRQIVSPAAVAALACEGAAFLRCPPEGWAVPLAYKQQGSLLLGSGEVWEKLRRDAEIGRQQGLETEIWSKERASKKVSLLKNAQFEGAVWCPSDGVVDIHALLSGYLKGASAMGVKIRYGDRVRSIERRAGRIDGVVTDRETIRCEAVINAAGPWASITGEMVGAVKALLRPCRRHLFVTAPLSWVDPQWPFVWDVTHDLYFRPDSGGLLLGPCDEVEMPPCDAPVDASIVELLAEKVRRYLPEAASVPIKKGWAGLRTLSQDGRFVIGWDPQVEGFFWVAGLGGHGVTTSAAIGALAANLILDGQSRWAEDFSPRRFI